MDAGGPALCMATGKGGLRVMQLIKGDKKGVYQETGNYREPCRPIILSSADNIEQLYFHSERAQVSTKLSQNSSSIYQVRTFFLWKRKMFGFFWEGVNNLFSPNFLAASHAQSVQPPKEGCPTLLAAPLVKAKPGHTNDFGSSTCFKSCFNQRVTVWSITHHLNGASGFGLVERGSLSLCTAGARLPLSRTTTCEFSRRNVALNWLRGQPVTAL
jgi:hypothetical protein